MDTPKPRRPSKNPSGEQIWQIVARKKLPRTFACPVADLFETLEKRESRREFAVVDIQAVSTTLWFAQRYVSDVDKGQRVTTPVPTAGALASVRTIVVEPRGPAWIYEPQNHEAGILDASLDVCQEIRGSASQFFDIGKGWLLIFAASRSYISSYYENPDTLIYREAGVLIGTMALIAEALELAFCPLGTTGGKWLSRLIQLPEEVAIPGGAAVIGGR